MAVLVCSVDLTSTLGTRPFSTFSKLPESGVVLKRWKNGLYLSLKTVEEWTLPLIEDCGRMDSLTEDC